MAIPRVIKARIIKNKTNLRLWINDFRILSKSRGVNVELIPEYYTTCPI